MSSEVLGNSVQELLARLSDLSNPSSESTAWWQSLLQNVPYLGGLVEPDSGRMLFNLGDEGYVLLTGDIQSIEAYTLPQNCANHYYEEKVEQWQNDLNNLVKNIDL